MGKRGVRDLNKEAAWRRIVGRQADSGLSVRAWRRRNDVSEASFYSWRRELAKRDAEQPSSMREVPGQPTTSFVPVQVAREPRRDSEQTYVGHRESDGQIEIVLAGGVRVRVSGPVDQQMLSAVLEALALADAAAAERRAC